MGRDVETGRFTPKHGARHTKLYRVWCSMRERCNNPNNKSYHRYGFRGIKVCKDWDDFDRFRLWAFCNGYADGLTIDRIDNNAGYSPQNCRWVTTAQQNRNYSRNHILTYKGESLCLKDMAEKYGVNPATLRFRLKSGISIGEALSSKDRRVKNG